MNYELGFFRHANKYSVKNACADVYFESTLLFSFLSRNVMKSVELVFLLKFQRKEARLPSFPVEII